MTIYCNIIYLLILYHNIGYTDTSLHVQSTTKHKIAVPTDFANKIVLPQTTVFIKLKSLNFIYSVDKLNKIEFCVAIMARVKQQICWLLE